MVISRRLRCIYVELPHTGSTSVSEELCAHYGGERILRKHAQYREFYRAASPDERRYFVFSGIRNPLDEVVSLYFRYKTNHTSSFSNPSHLERNGGWVTEKHLRQYRFVTEEKGNFEGYVRTFYRRPYDNWSRVAHHQFDFVMRWERLQEDFAKLLELRGISHVRSLPRLNRTAERATDFASYYTRDLQAHVVRIFSPFMRRWDYRFPAGWPAPNPSVADRLHFELQAQLRRAYVRWIRRRTIGYLATP